jgi:hypothetical protein
MKKLTADRKRKWRRSAVPETAPEAKPEVASSNRAAPEKTSGQPQPVHFLQT